MVAAVRPPPPVITSYPLPPNARGADMKACHLALLSANSRCPRGAPSLLRPSLFWLLQTALFIGSTVACTGVTPPPPPTPSPACILALSSTRIRAKRLPPIQPIAVRENPQAPPPLEAAHSLRFPRLPPVRWRRSEHAVLPQSPCLQRRAFSLK
jgi:hypothetical protein